MLGAAKATYYQGWIQKMNELKKVDVKAWTWLIAIPTKCWFARGKPILTMCEWIRKYLMNRHVVAVLSYRKQNHDDFVDECYTREKYAIFYGFSVTLINGQEMWSEVQTNELLPPVYKNGPGRSRKVRIKECGKDGSRRRRPGVAYKCSKCDKFGHNALSCKSLT
ncbi:unnamed protein product [Lathyrus sativus]|nr:unnamed protein product [Lathyrus sativus]